MGKLKITGGTPLTGEITVSGSKNAILPILAGALLTQGNILIKNCPRYLDVINMVSILEVLGCEVEWEGSRLSLHCGNADKWEMPERLAKELRSSIFMLGPVIGRFHKAKFTYPGGCEIGQRPIDLHLKGLRALKVDIKEEYGFIHCDGAQLEGGEIHLDYPSVGATENIMMAAVLAKGTTRILNAAREPEILNLQQFLNAMGARVKGAGSSTIEIIGVKSLHDAEFTIMPDRIVAGTYMVGAAITGGDLLIHNVCREHIQSVSSKLMEAGCQIQFEKTSAWVRGPKRPREMHLLETLPYPGFPTDMQAQMFALATIADGTSIIVENVFENRFKHAVELARMGANVTIKDRTAVIRGVERLSGAQVAARDLRGGAALVLAGLVADGETEVENTEYIARGYEDLGGALKSLGAQITEEMVMRRKE